MACLFFKKLFWFLKFYFIQFDPDWRLIDLDFLGKGWIGRIWTKIKKASNMDDALEVLGKICFGPLTLKITKIIQFWYFDFFKI
jgi:hypothetical protein